MSQVLFAFTAALLLVSTGSYRREVRYRICCLCFRVWPMLTPLRKITCFEESNFPFREIVKRRGYHTLLYIVVYFLTD